MGIVQGKGFSLSKVEPFSKGSKIHASHALSESSIIPLSKSSKIHASHALSESSIIPLGHLAKEIIWSISAISSTKIRINFDRGMLKSSLLDYLNYTITPVTPYGSPLYFTLIEPENINEPTFIDIITSEMTNGVNYQCVIESSSIGPRDTEEIFIDPASDTKTFVGLGVKPEIKSVVAIGLNRVDVIFSETMEDNTAIRDKTNYSFDKGLSVLDILEFSKDTVKLVTSDQIEGELYTLTITN